MDKKELSYTFSGNEKILRDIEIYLEDRGGIKRLLLGTKGNIYFLDKGEIILNFENDLVLWSGLDARTQNRLVKIITSTRNPETMESNITKLVLCGRDNNPEVEGQFDSIAYSMDDKDVEGLHTFPEDVPNEFEQIAKITPEGRTYLECTRKVKYYD